MSGRKRRGDEVVAEILLDQLAIMRSNVRGAKAGNHPEALHDLRVALRRSRSLLKGFPGVFRPADHERFKAHFKELQGVTSPVRDYDVLLAKLEEFAERRPQLEPDTAALRKELLRQRRGAQAKLKRRLDSKRFADLLDAWESLLRDLPTSAENHRPDAATRIDALAAERISEDRKRFIKLGKAALDSGAPADVHHARKRGKALRYNLEFFGHLGHKKRAKRLRHRLKKIQDELGDYQDTVVQEAVLREAAGTQDASLAAGAMIEQALAARELRFKRFARRFKKLR